jgi:hypothetical protein
MPVVDGIIYQPHLPQLSVNYTRLNQSPNRVQRAIDCHLRGLPSTHISNHRQPPPRPRVQHIPLTFPSSASSRVEKAYVISSSPSGPRLTMLLAALPSACAKSTRDGAWCVHTSRIGDPLPLPFASVSRSSKISRITARPWAVCSSEMTWHDAMTGTNSLAWRTLRSSPAQTWAGDSVGSAPAGLMGAV